MNERLAIYTLARVPKMGEIRQFSGAFPALFGHLRENRRGQRRSAAAFAFSAGTWERRPEKSVESSRSTQQPLERHDPVLAALRLGIVRQTSHVPLDLGGGDLIGNRNIPLPRIVRRRLIERLGADKDDALHARPSAGALADERVGPARIPQPTCQSIPTSKIRPTGFLNTGVGR